MLALDMGADKAVECAAWLKEIGITDYNGFAPLTDTEESTDFYMSVNLATKIKGLSSLPKVEDVSMDTTKLQSYGIKQDSIEKSIARLIKLKN